MKAKIHKTGEIVDIKSYNDISTTSISKYIVSYIDSQGVEHGREGSDYHLDFEPIDNLTHWQDIRERAAIAAMQGLLSNARKTGSCKEYVEAAIEYANTLVKELKKK